MNRLVPALALALVVGTPVVAEDSNLRAVLSVLPDTVFSDLTPDVARYLDLSALAEAHGGALGREALSRALLGGGIRPAEALALGSPDSFAEKSGIDSAALAFVAGIGQPPGAVSVWGLADADAATTAFSGLSGRGFTELPSKMIANGEPGIVDLATRDPADPWRGPMGQASVVGLSGRALLQAGDGAALESLLAGGPSALDTLAGRILLDALEAEEGAVLQAAFLGAWHGLGGGIDPATLAGKNPDEARAALEQAAAGASSGLPLWQGAALADLETPEGPALALAFAYADCTDAQAAAEGAADLWREMEGTAEHLAEASVVKSQPSGCAAILRIAGHGGTPRPFNQATHALMAGNLPALRIGTGD